jgi:hypothetical protein
LLEHTSSALLAYWAPCYEVDDLSVVYAVVEVHLVQVGSGLSGGAVLTVVNVAYRSSPPRAPGKMLEAGRVKML